MLSCKKRWQNSNVIRKILFIKSSFDTILTSRNSIMTASCILSACISPEKSYTQFRRNHKASGNSRRIFLYFTFTTIYDSTPPQLLSEVYIKDYYYYSNWCDLKKIYIVVSNLPYSRKIFRIFQCAVAFLQTCNKW